MTAAANTIDLVSLFYAEAHTSTPLLWTSEGFCQRGCLGGKPIALSPIDGVRSVVGVRTLVDSLVYNPQLSTPRFPSTRLSLFPLSTHFIFVNHSHVC